MSKNVTKATLILLVLLLATIGCSGDGPTSSNSQDLNGIQNSFTKPTYEPPKINNDPDPEDFISAKKTIDFEDILEEVPGYNMRTQHALITYKDIEWDNDGRSGGTGWGVYNTSNSKPHTKANYLMNRHGLNFIGFTFPHVVTFKGAHFAMATSNQGMDPYNLDGHSATKIRYHFYDENLELISTSDWFELQPTSRLFEVYVNVKRVVVEHDVYNTTTAGFGVSDAEWFSMDDMIIVDSENDDGRDDDPNYNVNNIVTFDNILDEIPSYNMNTQHALVTFQNTLWDNDGLSGGTGWGVYRTNNSIPHSGSNYVLNRHGKNYIGFTFSEVVNFKGAYFAKASSNSWMDADDLVAHSAVQIRYHFYDGDLNLISISDWFDLQKTPELFIADINVKRVVVEHDLFNTTTAGFGVTDAEWFSMDDVMFDRIDSFIAY